MTSLDELERLAGEAERAGVKTGKKMPWFTEHWLSDQLQSEVDAAYIAAANPQTMLALLAVVRNLAARCESAEQCMTRLTADHNTTPNYVRGFDMANTHFATYSRSALDGVAALEGKPQELPGVRS